MCSMTSEGHSLGALITFTRGVHGDRHTGTVSLRVVLLGIGTFLNTSSRISLNETVDCGAASRPRLPDRGELAGR
jgi:hypothetical protein